MIQLNPSELKPSTPIIYNTDLKQFIICNKINKNTAFIGWVLDYDKDTEFINVLYRGFLNKEPLKFPMTLKPMFIQSFIFSEFERMKFTIKENMPRIKKLKRLNLKMLTREYAVHIYTYLNDYINTYEILYGYVEAQKLKAQIATTPFYINDNGIIKLYNIWSNELTIPDLESEGFFLAYFSFKNKTN